MSHNTHMTVYPYNCNKRAVQSYWDEVAKHEDYEEGCSGLPSNIKWEERKVFNSYEEAENYIESRSNEWYLQIAVPFLDIKIKETATIKALKERISTYTEKKNLLETELFCKGFKSVFYCCKHCKSKLAIKYLVNNKCPVCRTDLRSETVLKQITRYSEIIHDCNEKLKAEEIKAREKAKSKNSTKKWLVKIEYHT